MLLGWSLLVYLMCGDAFEPAQVGQLFDEAIACTERSGDQVLRSNLHNNAGVHFLCVGDIPAARAHLEQAEEATQAAGTVNADIQANLGWVLRQENDPDGAQDRFETALRVSRRHGDRYCIAEASVGLACVAADLADWGRAAELHGIAQAFVERVVQPWQEPVAGYRGDSLDKVRTSLGEAQFERAYAKGMMLSLDQALDLALEGPAPPDTDDSSRHVARTRSY